MSETNSSDHSQVPESSNSASSWFAGWDDFSAEAQTAHSTGDTPAPSSNSQQDWQTVNFPNAISADAIERQAVYSHEPAAQPQPTDPWSTRTITPNASPVTWADTPQSEAQLDVAEMISLIQELNQCNNALLDRVSQLEEALDQTQRNMLNQERSHPANANAQELAATQEQLSYLFTELEMAHQTSQRQQVLIETLSEQLSTSQERVAELERECALTQQRYNEQTQLLYQSENACRDLRVRLQRQQRYTLQFKAALERCLEVPGTPHGAAYQEPIRGEVVRNEAVQAVQTEEATVPNPVWEEPQAPLTAQPLLPKVAQIQPWSSHTGGRGVVPFKLDALLGRSTVEEPEATEPETPDVPETTTTPVLPFPAKAELDPVLATPTPPAELLTAASESAFDLTDPAILQAEALKAAAAELQSVLDGLMKDPPAPPELNSDAEAALWQDLARLVDVSSDEVVHVNQAQDQAEPQASAVESVELESAEFTSAATSEPNQEAIASVPPLSSDNLPKPLPPLDSQLLSIPFQSTPSISQRGAAVHATMTNAAEEKQSPSPLVYPKRPPKKIESLAAVDLPTFPR